jgi:hypothetical protein
VSSHFFLGVGLLSSRRLLRRNNLHPHCDDETSSLPSHNDHDDDCSSVPVGISVTMAELSKRPVGTGSNLPLTLCTLIEYRISHTH